MTELDLVVLRVYVHEWNGPADLTVGEVAQFLADTRSRAAADEYRRALARFVRTAAPSTALDLHLHLRTVGVRDGDKLYDECMKGWWWHGAMASEDWLVGCRALLRGLDIRVVVAACAAMGAAGAMAAYELAMFWVDEDPGRRAQEVDALLGHIRLRSLSNDQLRRIMVDMMLRGQEQARADAPQSPSSPAIVQGSPSPTLGTWSSPERDAATYDPATPGWPGPDDKAAMYDPTSPPWSDVDNA